MTQATQAEMDMIVGKCEGLVTANTFLKRSNEKLNARLKYEKIKVSPLSIAVFSARPISPSAIHMHFVHFFPVSHTPCLLIFPCLPAFPIP